MFRKRSCDVLLGGSELRQEMAGLAMLHAGLVNHSAMETQVQPEVSALVQIEAAILSRYTAKAIVRLLGVQWLSGIAVAEYDSKNTWHWDPKKRLQADSSSESSDDGGHYDSDYDERPQVFRSVFSTVAEDGFQPVVNKRSQSNARPHGWPPAHLKAYPHGMQKLRDEHKMKKNQEEVMKALEDDRTLTLQQIIIDSQVSVEHFHGSVPTTREIIQPGPPSGNSGSLTLLCSHSPSRSSIITDRTSLVA